MTVDDVLRESRNDTVRSLVRALELHGPGEGAHSERVAVYATATGDQIGMDEDELLDLRWAAALHDVGKISVDPKLLKKFGKLTDEEMQLMRTHAELAMKVIGELNWLRNVVPMVRHHHERFDGSGYPEGFAGDDIPIGARIIAVAETFDVLTEECGWRDPMSYEAGIEEIRRCAGAQFDPDVVDAFCLVQPIVQPIGMDA